MASVVLLKGVNVGGNRSFRPSALAKELAELDVTSLGAAGTFVVRARIARAALRAELAARLPAETEILVVPARELLALVEDEPFGGQSFPDGVQAFLTTLARRPARAPALPARFPSERDWQVDLRELRGRFVLGLRRRTEAKLLYPNEVVEREFGVPATTRTWATVEKVAKALRAG